MSTIDALSNTDPGLAGQSDDGFSPLNPAAPNEIVRRGQEVMGRKRRGFEDWLLIAEALDVGRTEIMRAVNTNGPKGKRYEKAMGEWLVANGFKEINKGARSQLHDCLKHRAAIEKWRVTLTEGERFSFNHPDTVLRKWKANTAVPDPNAPPKKPSPVAKLKESIAHLEEGNHRLREEIAHGGGDLWSRDNRVEDIADIMLAKLTSNKAERVARTILKKLNDKKKTAPPKPGAQNAAAFAEDPEAYYAAEEAMG